MLAVLKEVQQSLVDSGIEANTTVCVKKAGIAFPTVGVCWFVAPVCQRNTRELPFNCSATWLHTCGLANRVGL